MLIEVVCHVIRVAHKYSFLHRPTRPLLVMPQLQDSAQSLSVCDTALCSYDQTLRPRKSRHRVLHDVEIDSCQAHPATAIDR
jgi:hypothetical protein